MTKYIASIIKVNGQPCLAVNGKPRFLQVPFLHKAPYESFERAKCGIYMVWDPPIPILPDGKVNTTGIEKEADAILEKEPEALLVLRTCLKAPDWWMDTHPSEVMKFDVDVSKYACFENYRDASWASSLWLETLKNCFDQTCRYLHQKYQGRFILYQFGLGSCGENNLIGACASDGRWFCSDFSPAMTNYFRRWLTKKYHTDHELQIAWSMPEVTLQNATVPPREERLKTDWFTFRDPRKSWVADYYCAFAERVQELIIEICSTIKKATNNESLAGSHLGALMDNGFHAYLYNQITINRFKEALAHPAVDTFTSPASYENREPGGDSTSMMPVGSYLLHNKLIYQDQDTRTFHIPQKNRRAYKLGKIASDLLETEGVIIRDVAQAIIRGYGFWWHAMIKGMYDHPGIQNCIARLSQIARNSLHFSRGIAEGMAIIVDEESAFYQQCANRLFYPMLYRQRQHEWGKSGIAWDLFLHNDLSNPSIPDHKLYYFLNTFYLADKEIEAIEKKVKRNNTVVIWTYAPGIQSPSGINLERTNRLTGFHLKAVNVEALPRITLTKHDHPYVCLNKNSHGVLHELGDIPSYIGAGPMGNDQRDGIFGPLIYVDDPDAEVLGELDALQVPGFCVKKFKNWTSVFVAAPSLNSYIIRNIARASGIHVYSETNDVILPGKSFISLHAIEEGEKKICLHKPQMS